MRGEEYGVADQAVTSPAGGVVRDTTHQGAAHHGRPSSWIVIATIVIGFCIGGAALPAGPIWWLFWVGAGIVVLGAIGGAATHILDDWY